MLIILIIFSLMQLLIIMVLAACIRSAQISRAMEEEFHQILEKKQEKRQPAKALPSTN